MPKQLPGPTGPIRRLTAVAWPRCGRRTGADRLRGRPGRPDRQPATADRRRLGHRRRCVHPRCGNRVRQRRQHLRPGRHGAAATADHQHRCAGRQPDRCLHLGCIRRSTERVRRTGRRSASDTSSASSDPASTSAAASGSDLGSSSRPARRVRPAPRRPPVPVPPRRRLRAAVPAARPTPQSVRIGLQHWRRLGQYPDRDRGRPVGADRLRRYRCQRVAARA